MPDHHDTAASALDERALLAAYLDGDTDAVTTRRLERRLAEDTDLAARLDAIAETRAQLQRLERITAPDDVRQRLARRLTEQRVASAGRAAMTTRRRPFAVRLAPLAAAAAIVLVAVLGVATVLPRSGSDGVVSQSADGVEGAAAESRAGQADDTGAEEAAADLEAEPGVAAPGALADDAAGAADIAGPAPVRSDADIAERVERLLDDPPADLRRRERRLRRDAGLSSARACVEDFDAATVDLVSLEGRTSLVVPLEDGSDQIVLVDPATCAPLRTISRD